jgi:hypothetical protein
MRAAPQEGCSATLVGNLFGAYLGTRNSLCSRFVSFAGDRGVYPVVIIDAIVVEIRNGQVVNRPI